MFSFFKKKQAPAEENKPFVVKAYLSGKVVPIEEVKDEVFSSKALGDGLAIEPEENVIVAPCDATVSVLMEGSRHAVGLTLANGVEILIHEGIDTVNMKAQETSCFHLIQRRSKNTDMRKHVFSLLQTEMIIRI